MHTAKGSSSESCQREAKGNSRAPSAVPWPPRQSSARRAPGPKGPWRGFASPHCQRLTPWVPRECVRDVGSLALSSPAETCAGGWGLILRVWVPSHSPNSGEAAPEARPAGGALRARLIGESTASSVASLLGRKGGSRAQSRGKPRATAGLLQRFLGRPDKAPHGEHQVPRAPGWVLHPHTARG